MLDKLTSVTQRASLSNLSSLQLFQLIRYATFIFIGIGFAKLQVSLSDIGTFETFILISGMVSFFWVSGMINTMLSIYPRKNEQERRELLFGTFMSLALFSFVAAGLLFTFSQNLLSSLDKKEDGSVIRLAVIYLLLNGPSFISEYILFLNEKRKEIIYYALFSSVATLTAALVPAMLNYGVEYSLYGMIIVAAFKFILTLFLLNRFAVFTFDWKTQIENLKLSLPLLLSIFVGGSAEYIDSVIVKSKFNDVSFAVFRYGARELPVLLILANTLSMAMVPAIAKNLDEGLVELKKKSTQLMHLLFPFSILLMLSSRYVYEYVFSESFIYSSLIFNIYLLLIIPRVLFPQTILTGMQKTKFLLLSSVMEIALNVSLSIWLAGKFGLPGIAFGTLLAYLFDKIFLIAVNSAVNKIPLSRYLNIRLFCIYSITACIAFIFSYYLMAKFS